jgi:hypothetical protein
MEGQVTLRTRLFAQVYTERPASNFCVHQTKIILYVSITISEVVHMNIPTHSRGTPNTINRWAQTDTTHTIENSTTEHDNQARSRNYTIPFNQK